MKLSDAAIAAMKTPDMREKLKAQELEPLILGPRELGEFIKSEAPYWNEFIRNSGIKVEQ